MPSTAMWKAAIATVAVIVVYNMIAARVGLPTT